MKFTVVREKWLRGGRDGKGKEAKDSFLRDAAGQQCCLGFLAREAGYKKKDILLVGVPNDILETHPSFPEDLFYSGDDDNAIVNRIIFTNDSKDLPEEKREKKLKKLFGKLGIKIRFRNKSEV